MNELAQTVVIAAFLAFCRIGGCFMIMPGLSSIRLPLQIPGNDLEPRSVPVPVTDPDRSPR